MYRRVKTEGNIVRKSPLSMRYLRSTDIEKNCIGFVLRKRAGNAVFRNAIRRVLREVFREIQTTFTQPTWVVFEVSDKAAESTRTVLRQNAEFLLQSLCKVSV